VEPSPTLFESSGGNRGICLYAGRFSAGALEVRILFVSPYLPSLVRVRPYNFLRTLARRGHEIWLFCLVYHMNETSNLDELTSYCKKIETVYLPLARSLMNCATHAVSPVALQSAYCFSPALKARVQEVLSAERFDVVHVEHIRAAHFLPDGTKTVPAVFDSVDCITSLYRQFSEDKPSKLGRLIARIESRKLAIYEPQQASRFDRVIVTSDRDRRELLNIAPHLRVDVISNGVDLEYFGIRDELGDSGNIVLSGKMSYYANEAAARYLCSEILPLVRAREPKATLTIVGSSPSKRVLRCGALSGVQVTGHVPDMRPFVGNARVGVCPITVGAGVQNKVLEAMAMGRPVVATSRACRALSVVDGEHLLIADEPGTFADAVVKLLHDDKLALRLGRNGREYVEKNHNWDDKARQLEETYSKAIGGSRSG